MKIESRVEALELELKILKNEIQATLLEIREQVLNHYYPELRAEEPQRIKLSAAKPALPKVAESHPAKGGTERSNTNGRAPVTPQSSAETKAQIQPFSDIFLQDLEDEEDDLDSEYIPQPRRVNTIHIDNALDDDEFEEELDDFDEEPMPPTRRATVTPKTREVDFRQMKQSPANTTPNAAPKVKPKAKPEVVETPGPKANRRNFAALAAWVGESIAKVGKERTIQVVETYAATGGALSDEAKSSILRLASLASDAEPSGPVGNQEMLGLMVSLDHLLSEQ